MRQVSTIHSLPKPSASYISEISFKLGFANNRSYGLVDWMDVSGQSWSQSIFLRDGKNVINFFFNKEDKISILKFIKFLPVSDTELYESANFTF